MLQLRDPGPQSSGPQSSGPLIAAMVADLSPVAALRPSSGLIAGLAATALTTGVVALLFGWRADILAGHPSMLVVARSSVLLLGGGAMLLGAVLTALPGRDDRWASRAGGLLLGVLPLGLAALAVCATVGDAPLSFAAPLSFGEVGGLSAARCLAISLGCALLVAGAITLWLCRAAPTRLARAGWLSGWAAGALGTFAYSLYCPSNTLEFAATIYPAAVLLSAALSRLILPQLVRW